MSGPPTQPCPSCGYTLEADMPADADLPEDMAPSPGDWSVCFNCASILRFDENLERQILDQDDYEDVDAEELAGLRQIQAAIRDQLDRGASP